MIPFKYRPFFKPDFKKTFNIDGYKSIFDKEKGYVVVEPYPTQSELEQYYEGSYFEEGDLVKHDYLKDEKIYQANYLKYIDSIFKYIDTKKEIKILDYGCGVGTFVRTLSNSKYSSNIESIEGYDLSTTAVSLASQNTDSKKASFFTLDQLNKNNKYDLISMLEVIEHVPDIHKVIYALSENLKDEGLMFITTPNYNSFEQRFYKNKWRLFCPPEHINYFTKNSLSNLLNKNGFNVLEIHDEFIFSFTFGLRKKISNISPLIFIRFLGAIKKFLIYKVFNSVLRTLGFEGGKITFIAQKDGNHVTKKI